MNNISMIGRLTASPELKRTPNDTAVTSFVIAVDRKYKKEGQPDTDFFNVIAFKNTAEFISRYFTKGQRIGITGCLQNRRWKDKNDIERITAQIIVESCDFCEKKEERTEGYIRPSAPQQAPTYNNDYFTVGAPEGGDLPFN